MNIDTYSPTTTTGALLFSIGGYDSNREHDLTLVNVSSSRGVGTLIVDRIGVFDGELKAIPPSRTQTFYEENNTHLTRTGTWANVTHPGYSGGIASVSSTLNSTYVAKFKGWGIQWYGARVPGGGQAHIYINGVYKMTINTDSPTVQAGALLYSEGGYNPAIENEFKIVVTNAYGKGIPTAVVVDRIAVFDGTLVAPPPGRVLTFYEETNTLLTRTGTWASISHPDYSGGLASVSSTLNSTYVAKFKGWGIQWYGARVPGGGQAHIYINGVYKMTINTDSPTVQAGVLLYTEGGYDPNIENEFKIVVTHAAGKTTPTAVVVDRIGVFDGTLVGTISPAIAEDINTESLPPEADEPSLSLDSTETLP
jgi:protein-S-isoprenylcysteine O-methyltransferase Ste14